MLEASDVAEYILEKTGQIPCLKLQKLLYYSQAWSYVWDEKPLFKEKIYAWSIGPIVPEIYILHRGLFRISKLGKGDFSKLNEEQRETVDSVIEFYASESSHYLSELVREEEPWKIVRAGMKSSEQCDREITSKSMYDYYFGLLEEEGEN